MTIKRSSPYGEPGALPADGVVAANDGEARGALECARVEGRPYPVIGLLGGDLARTLGGPGGGEARLRSDAAVTFPIDVGEVLVDGRHHLFVAHLVARTRTWSYTFAAMNAQWWRDWNLGPRAHPGDGLLDTYEAGLGLRERLKVRARLPLGAHLPHPGIRERRTAGLQVDLPRGLDVVVDHCSVGPARHLVLRVLPDAATVVV